MFCCQLVLIQYCLILSTTTNNVGNEALFNPVVSTLNNFFCIQSLETINIFIVKTEFSDFGNVLRNSTYFQVKRIQVKLDGRVVGRKEGILIRKGF